MSHLTAKEYRRLLDIIDIIYSVKDRNALLQAVCKELEPLLPVSSAVFFGVNGVNLESKTPIVNLDDHCLFRVKLSDLNDYAAHYAPQDPFYWGGCWQNTRNQAKTYSDYIPLRQHKETEFTRDFLSRIPMLYCMGAVLGAHNRVIGILGLHRQACDADFNARDKEIFNRLLPHLARALLDLHHHQPTLGVILLDENGCPVYTNNVAEYVTNECSIPELLTVAASNGIVRMQTGSYSVNFIKLREGKDTVIFLNRLADTLPLHWKLSAFCLTPKQKEIVLHALQGLSNKEIAERLFISLQTVKDHLHDIYKKMQVTGRCELMAKVLGT